MKADNRTAIITGANGDIGRRLTKQLLEGGFRVAALDRPGSEKALDGYGAFGESFRFLPLDIRQKEAVETAVNEVFHGWGRIDCLVNCAGIFRPRPFLEMTEEDWDDTMAVNLHGTFWACQAAAPHMIASGRGGRIVNMSSGLASRVAIGVAHYAASKAGVEGLTHVLALELAPHKINVNALAPGMVESSMPRNALGEEALKSAAAATPLKRLALPEDISEVIAFLLSPESSFITGQIIHVNGGGFMAW
ncbi:MAG: SDR family NAD(P)-dependent oxidoreductase [Dehalococcoidia bacterium]|nr:SDR family NAD(P)-dependent oxidoreductase [Dehalococcoidia bacterium]